MPFTPCADETCFDPGDDICVVLQQRSQLLNMIEDLRLGCIWLRIRIWSLIVGKGEYGFDSRVTDIIEIGLQTIEDFFRNIGLAAIVEADVEVDERIPCCANRTETRRARKFVWCEESTLGVEDGGIRG